MGVQTIDASIPNTDASDSVDVEVLPYVTQPYNFLGERVTRRNYFVCAVILSLLSMTVTSQERRHVKVDGDRPLATYVEPTDRRVVVEGGYSRPQRIGPMPGETRAHFLGLVSDVVLVIRVERLRGTPAYRSQIAARVPPESTSVSEDKANWIVQTVTARVERVLKGGPEISEGGEFTFREDYGAAVVRGVSIELVIPWLRPLVPGRRYLLFATFGSEGEFFRNEAYEEPAPGALLERTYLDADLRPQDEFEQLGLEQAIAHVENELRK